MKYIYIFIFITLNACQPTMRYEGKITPYEEENLTPPEGTVPYYSQAKTVLKIRENPSLEDLKTGKKQYNIYCSVCHGYDGYGNGIVPKRGFTNPPSFHNQRLKEASPSYFVEVINNGFGAMYSYAERISIPNRWRISLYIQALQLSQSKNIKNESVKKMENNR